MKQTVFASMVGFATVMSEAAGAGVAVAIAVNMALKAGMLTVIAGVRAGALTLEAFGAMTAAGASALFFA